MEIKDDVWNIHSNNIPVSKGTEDDIFKLVGYSLGQRNGLPVRVRTIDKYNAEEFKTLLAILRMTKDREPVLKLDQQFITYPQNGELIAYEPFDMVLSQWNGSPALLSSVIKNLLQQLKTLLLDCKCTHGALNMDAIVLKTVSGQLTCKFIQLSSLEFEPKDPSLRARDCQAMLAIWKKLLGDRIAHQDLQANSVDELELCCTLIAHRLHAPVRGELAVFQHVSSGYEHGALLLSKYCAPVRSKYDPEANESESRTNAAMDVDEDGQRVTAAGVFYDRLGHQEHPLLYLKYKFVTDLALQARRDTWTHIVDTQQRYQSMQEFDGCTGLFFSLHVCLRRTDQDLYYFPNHPVKRCPLTIELTRSDIEASHQSDLNAYTLLEHCLARHCPTSGVHLSPQYNSVLFGPVITQQMECHINGLVVCENVAIDTSNYHAHAIDKHNVQEFISQNVFSQPCKELLLQSVHYMANHC